MRVVVIYCPSRARHVRLAWLLAQSNPVEAGGGGVLCLDGSERLCTEPTCPIFLAPVEQVLERLRLEGKEECR